MSTTRLLIFLVLMWISLSVFMLRPAAGQSSHGEGDRLIFAWSSLSLPNTPSSAALMAVWGAACLDLGGPTAKLKLTPGEAAFSDLPGRVVPAIYGLCMVPPDNDIPTGDSSA